jgi:hypothetical protein
LNVSAAHAGISAVNGTLTAYSASSSVVSTMSVSGSYSTSNDSLYLSGAAGADTFSCAGAYADGIIEGTWTATSGDSGGFATLGGSGRRVPKYLGLAESTGAFSPEQFDFVINGSTLVGVSFIADERQFFNGSVKGDSVTIVYILNRASVKIGLGSIDQGGGTASGTYDIPGVDQGFWAVTEEN